MRHLMWHPRRNKVGSCLLQLLDRIDDPDMNIPLPSFSPADCVDGVQISLIAVVNVMAKWECICIMADILKQAAGGSVALRILGLH